MFGISKYTAADYRATKAAYEHAHEISREAERVCVKAREAWIKARNIIKGQLTDEQLDTLVFERLRNEVTLDAN